MGMVDSFFPRQSNSGNSFLYKSWCVVLVIEVITFQFIDEWPKLYLEQTPPHFDTTIMSPYKSIIWSIRSNPIWKEMHRIEHAKYGSALFSHNVITVMYISCYKSNVIDGVIAVICCIWTDSSTIHFVNYRNIIVVVYLPQWIVSPHIISVMPYSMMRM